MPRLEIDVRRLHEREEGAQGAGGVQVVFEGIERRPAARRATFDALEDDLNTAGALGALFSFVKATNVDLEAGHLSASDATAARGLLREIAGDIFGIIQGT